MSYSERARKAWQTRKRNAVANTRLRNRFEAKERAEVRAAAGLTGRATVPPMFAKGFRAGRRLGSFQEVGSTFFRKDVARIKADLAAAKRGVNRHLLQMHLGKLKGVQAGRAEFLRGLKRGR